MGLFSAHQRAKIEGIEHCPPDQAKAMVQNYLENIARQDDRRLMWLMEAATNLFAEKVEDQEQKILVTEHFGRDAAEARQYLERYRQDFLFLYGLHRLLADQHMQRSSEGLAAYFRKQQKKKRS